MDQPVAIITGASRGIGRATAIELGRRGYRLTLTSRNQDELNTVSREVDGLAVAADVTDPKHAAVLVEQTLHRYGRIDVLVNNAGFAPARTIEQMSVDEWRAVIEVNLSAAFYLCKAAWETFCAQKSGVVVNISSFSARDPFAGFLAYGAAKAGLNLFGLALAREGREIGVRVHTIAPAAVETAMFRQILTAEQFSPDKTLDPAEVAQAIVQCIDGDMRHTSGEVIYLQKSP